jgi:hypothetical protein
MAKKKTTSGAAGAPETETIEDNKASDAPMVSILKVATAAKLSPRGGGELTYQVGRVGDAVVLRIHKNDSSGRFSSEWVTVDAIRKSLSQLPKGVTSFKGAVALRSAWTGLSSCNSGFGAAILRAEAVFAADPDPKKKGMLALASPDALQAWEQGILALPVPADAEQVLLHPPKAKPFFARKKDGEAAAGDAPDPSDESDAVGAVGDGDASGDVGSDDQDDAA